jgi:hypothetical protein
MPIAAAIAELVCEEELGLRILVRKERPCKEIAE